MNAIEVTGLRRAFGAVEALRGVDLHIRQGEFYGLLGPNGAGKTTLLRILSGLLRADGGEASIAGHRVPSANAGRQLGVVPQEIALYDMLSARKNLELFGAVQGLAGDDLARRVKAALEIVELEEAQHRRGRTFSGGMRRRLNLAVGLLHDPPVLLLDEPTVGVDPQSRAKIFVLLRDLNAAGKTIVYTTHYMEEAEQLCERIGIIDHGRLLAEGTLTELFARVNVPRFVRVFLPTAAAAQPVAGAEIVRSGDHVDYVPRSPVTIGALVTQIEQSGLPAERMEIVGPNLETLFLQLTVKELRD